MGLAIYRARALRGCSSEADKSYFWWLKVFNVLTQDEEHPAKKCFLPVSCSFDRRAAENLPRTLSDGA